MHLVISDASGDSAVFEYVDGKLVIHHGKQYRVVTNSPTYDKQLAIMEYWKDAGGTSKSLPGTSRAADRFVRTSFLLDVLPGEVSPTYISGTPQQSFKFQAPMAVLSLMRSVGTPLGFSLEETITPIVPIRIGDVEKTFRMAGELQEEGVMVNPIIPPAVSTEGTLIRVSVMATFSTAELGEALGKFQAVGKRLGMI
jgi:hypothetical protein